MTKPTKAKRRKSAAASSRPKWTPIDPAAAEKLTEVTSAPGLVFPLPTGALPKNVQRMPGVVSYYASAYTSPLPISPTVTIGGEMAVMRTDGDLRKGYNYVFASSSDGRVCFTGPYKDFPEHHVDKTEPVVIFTIFRNHPFNKPGGGGR